MSERDRLLVLGSATAGLASSVAAGFAALCWVGPSTVALLGVGGALAAAALAGALLSCQPSGADRPHTALGADAGELRAAFNDDAGKVRVVMLVAPT